MKADKHAVKIRRHGPRTVPACLKAQGSEKLPAPITALVTWMNACVDEMLSSIAAPCDILCTSPACLCSLSLLTLDGGGDHSRRAANIPSDASGTAQAREFVPQM